MPGLYTLAFEGQRH